MNEHISIIIPALNEEKYIGLCLESIKKLDYPSKRIEVIVVDNGSTDRTVEIARSFNCRVEKMPTVTIAALRNRGARIAKGDVLAFLDADCVVQADWIKNALSRFHDPAVGIVGCSLFLLPEDASWVEKTWKSQTKRTEGYVNWVGSGNMIIRRDTFNKLNGFNETMNTHEDCELCFRLRNELGLNIYSSKDNSVIHMKYRKTLKDFFKKELWHGKDVFRTFLNTKSPIKDSKAVLIALFYVLFIIGIIVSFIFFLISKNILPLIIVVSCSLIVPVILAVKKSSDKKKIAGLSLLYGIYGIARAFCIFNINNWLVISKKRKQVRHENY